MTKDKISVAMLQGVLFLPNDLVQVMSGFGSCRSVYDPVSKEVGGACVVSDSQQGVSLLSSVRPFTVSIDSFRSSQKQTVCKFCHLGLILRKADTEVGGFGSAAQFD